MSVNSGITYNLRNAVRPSTVSIRNFIVKLMSLENEYGTIPVRTKNWTDYSTRDEVLFSRKRLCHYWTRPSRSQLLAVQTHNALTISKHYDVQKYYNRTNYVDTSGLKNPNAPPCVRFLLCPIHTTLCWLSYRDMLTAHRVTLLVPSPHQPVRLHVWVSQLSWVTVFLVTLVYTILQ